MMVLLPLLERGGESLMLVQVVRLFLAVHVVAVGIHGRGLRVGGLHNNGLGLDGLLGQALVLAARLVALSSGWNIQTQERHDMGEGRKELSFTSLSTA